VELVPCPGLEKTIDPHTKEARGVSSYDHCNVLYKIAKELNLPMVLTDDGHFPEPRHATAQDAAYTVGQRKKIADKRRYSIAKYHYYCSGEEIMDRAREVMPLANVWDLQRACENTVNIAEMCEVELPRSTGPVYNVGAALEYTETMTAFDLLVRMDRGREAYRRSLGLLPDEDSPSGRCIRSGSPMSWRSSGITASKITFWS
jgi:DNA polymerase III alpha subunit